MAKSKKSTKRRRVSAQSALSPIEVLKKIRQRKDLEVARGGSPQLSEADDSAVRAAMRVLNNRRIEAGHRVVVAKAEDASANQEYNVGKGFAESLGVYPTNVSAAGSTLASSAPAPVSAVSAPPTPAPTSAHSPASVPGTSAVALGGGPRALRTTRRTSPPPLQAQPPLQPQSTTGPSASGSGQGQGNQQDGLVRLANALFSRNRSRHP